MKKRIFLSISYYGRAFHGSQRQSGLFTAQGYIEEILSKIYDEKIEVSCCSRLDKDVSTADWGVSYLTEKDISFYKLRYALNRNMESYMHINSIEYVPIDFFPRRDAYLKEYLYSISLKEADPLKDFTSFVPPFKLDKDKLIEALGVFKGKWDFSSFSSDEDFSKEDKMKTVTSIKSKVKDGYLLIYITGRGFLRYQVRYIIGSCYMYALNKLSLDNIKDRLEGKTSKGLKYKVPGIGLTLSKVKYKKKAIK